jgi:hypothetical protein
MRNANAPQPEGLKGNGVKSNSMDKEVATSTAGK